MSEVPSNGHDTGDTARIVLLEWRTDRVEAALQNVATKGDVDALNRRLDSMEEAQGRRDERLFSLLEADAQSDRNSREKCVSLLDDWRVRSAIAAGILILAGALANAMGFPVDVADFIPTTEGPATSPGPAVPPPGSASSPEAGRLPVGAVRHTED